MCDVSVLQYSKLLCVMRKKVCNQVTFIDFIFQVLFDRTMSIYNCLVQTDSIDTHIMVKQVRVIVNVVDCRIVRLSLPVCILKYLNAICVLKIEMKSNEQQNEKNQLMSIANFGGSSDIFYKFKYRATTSRTNTTKG